MVVFVWSLIFGNGIQDWNEWIFGAAFGVSLCRLTLPYILKEEIRGKRVSKR